MPQYLDQATFTYKSWGDDSENFHKTLKLIIILKISTGKAVDGNLKCHVSWCPGDDTKPSYHGTVLIRKCVKYKNVSWNAFQHRHRCLENYWTKPNLFISVSWRVPLLTALLFMCHIMPASCGCCASLNCVLLWVLWSGAASWRFMCSACIELFGTDRCRKRFRRIGGNARYPCCRLC